MSSPNTFIVPRTQSLTQQLPDGQHADKVALYVTGTWGVGEDAVVAVPTTTGTTVPLVDSGGTPVVVGVSRAYIELTGGILYTIIKPPTLAVAGLDYQLKPRIGPH